MSERTYRRLSNVGYSAVAILLGVAIVVSVVT